MIIDGFEKLTLLDYPENIACIIFTRGCNLRCPFCHNSSILDFSKEEAKFSEDEIFDYLEKRKNILDGVCITGGEPLLQSDIKEFIKKIKNLNLKVKLDTNGTNYSKLKELIEENLLDYVAMDIKNVYEKYSITTGIKNLDIESIKKSIALLKKNKIKYEFRTTIVKNYHTFEDIENLCKLVGKDSDYYIQNFINSNNVLEKKLESFSDEDLEKVKKFIENNYNNIKIRNM